MQEASDFIKVYVAEITALPFMTAEEQQALMNESPRSRSPILCSTAGPGQEGGRFVGAEELAWVERQDPRMAATRGSALGAAAETKATPIKQD
jgi:hypothetical protein